MLQELFNDPVLGQLTLSGPCAVGLYQPHMAEASYKGSFVAGKRSARLVLAVDGEETARVLARARQFVTEYPRYRTLAKTAMTEALLEDANETWLDGEEPLTPEQFQRRIQLKEATFGADGGIRLEFLTDMFGDHAVEVEIDERDQVLRADLA